MSLTSKEDGENEANLKGFLSEKVLQIYESTDVQNANEALVVILHTFMLGKEFITKGVFEHGKLQAMPKNWNSKGVYKICYSHVCCQEFSCSMTCILLYKTVCVQGIVCDMECQESVQINIKMDKYIKPTQDFSDPSAVYQNLEELSIYFKDGFCLPLLNLLHETMGCSPLYGICGLLDELKVCLLEFLPVEDVVSMSAVNKNFNNLANSPHLWKQLFYRDFAKDGIPDVESSDADWKQKYKEKYLEKKRLRRPGFHMVYNPYADIPFPDVFEPPPLFPPRLLPPPYLPPMFPFFRRQ